MNLQSPRAWLAFFSGTAVFMLALQDAGKVMPGELAKAHANVEELTAKDSCVLCHGGGSVSMGSSCLECHEVIGGQLDSEEGLHGQLGKAVAEGCSLCHSEHHGESFALVNARSFALAGSPDPGAFDHELIGFGMHGKHLELACSDCHENADVEVLDAGTTRFIGLDQNCSTCHEDPHEGRMERSCAECHGQETFQDFEEFEHDERFALIGSHSDVSCLQCHNTENEHSVENLDGSAGAPPVRGCNDCHEAPHATRFLRGVASLAGWQSEGDCTTCHLVEHEAFSGIGLEITVQDHASSGFALGPPHDALSCGDCHDQGLESFDLRYPGRAQEVCAACHEDPHDGQFDDGQFASGCLACHDRLAFEPHEFDVAAHAETRLELVSGHAELECSACHELPEAGGTRMFAGTNPSCDACHEDGHDGFFASVTEGLEPESDGDCARCHTSGTFSKVAKNRFNHLFWTDFNVAGAHAQNACESCHPQALTPDHTGRTFGRATETFGEVTGCASCHEDPHEGQFDRPDSPAVVDGRGSCARCHVESSFRSLERGFDHELWTGFGLEGTHSEISCSECHTPLPTRGAGDRSFARAIGTNCSDCHGYPHAGQFSIDGSTSCVRCHEAAAPAFQDLAFDHDTDSRFPLEDAHRLLDCADCHRPWTLGEGLEVIRYRPLGMDCADCHGSSEGGKARKKRRRG